MIILFKSKFDNNITTITPSIGLGPGAIVVILFPPNCLIFNYVYLRANYSLSI